MTADNSPMYAKGRIDGQSDALLIANCPPIPPLGPMPPDPDYPVMYMRGYADAMRGAVAHQCTEKCAREGQK